MMSEHLHAASFTAAQSSAILDTMQPVEVAVADSLGAADGTASDTLHAAIAASERRAFANDSLTGRVRETYEAICALRKRENQVLLLLC